MDRGHLTRQILEALLDRKVTPFELVVLLAHHLEEICPTCQEQVRHWIEQREDEPETPVDELEDQAPLQSLESEMQWLRDLRPLAAKEMRELMSLDAQERIRRVRRARTRFRNPLLIDLLLERSRELVSVDPSEAREVAALANIVALRLSGRYGADVLLAGRARATAFLANAVRVGGDLRSAHEILQGVLDHLDQLPDPLLRAEVWSFAASLRKDQRRFAEAEELHDRALEVYRSLGAPGQRAQILISSANLAYERGRLAAAIEKLREAVELLPEGEDPRMELYVGHNLAWYLSEAGDHAEAREIKWAHQPLYEQVPDPLIDWRGRWLDGRIAAGLGEAESAEESFLLVREQFIAAGIGFDAALVSLDLAMLYMDQGRNADVRRLAEEMLPIFRSQDIHREALASLVLFHKAVLADTATLTMVRDLASCLASTRDARGLDCEEPS